MQCTCDMHMLHVICTCSTCDMYMYHVICTCIFIELLVLGTGTKMVPMEIGNGGTSRARVSV